MKKERLYFLDNLKIFLVLLVVVHHVGQPYGGSNGFWYYVSNDHLNLGRFFSVNAGFFMSLFFLISAYFVPSSFERKGPKNFLKDRFIRLGIPLIFGFFVIMPILLYFYYINFRDYGKMSFFDYFFSVYLGFDGEPKDWTGPSWPDMQFGHMWFIEHLLVYGLLYSLFTYTCKGKESFKFLENISNWKLFIVMIFVAALTFIVRIQYPIDRWEGLLGFIQIEYAHFPQYASFFFLGILAFRYRWFDKLSPKIGITWLIIGVLLALTRYCTNIIPRSEGGFNAINAIYSIYETLLCFGLGFGLLYLFKTVFNKTNTFLNTLAENSFAVYIFHFPMAVLMHYAFTDLSVIPVIKFILASITTIVATFLFSIIIRRISFVRRII